MTGARRKSHLPAQENSGGQLTDARSAERFWLQICGSITLLPRAVYRHRSAVGPSMNWKTVVISVLTLIASANPPQPVAPADLVSHQTSRSLTVERRTVCHEAQALAIQRGRKIATFGHFGGDAAGYVGLFCSATQVISIYNGQLAMSPDF
jgi:hypothetical protein